MAEMRGLIEVVNAHKKVVKSIGRTRVGDGGLNVRVCAVGDQILLKSSRFEPCLNKR